MTFLDHASTTPLDDRVLRAMLPWFGRPANPSSVHRHGQTARAALEQAREQIAELFAVAPHHVVFTSGATEANNLAMRGLAAIRPAPLRIVLSALEHACIRETARALERIGAAQLHWLPVTPGGTADLTGAPESANLLCLMAVQNETGVLQCLEEARAWKLACGACWLCDITQAAGLMELNLGLRGIDLASLSSHKVHGPPGVGALVGPWVEALPAQISGGPQENEHRAGTQPIALIVGFAEALRLAAHQRRDHAAKLECLANDFLATLAAQHAAFRHNGGETTRLPGFLNLSFDGFSGADLVIALDARGFSVSSGPACATGVIETSAALAAMFPGDPARAAGALRITPGRETTREAMVACATALAQIVNAGGLTGRYARRPTSQGDSP